MVSDEKTTTVSTKSEDGRHEQKIASFSSTSNSPIPLRSIRGGGLSKADRVKGVTRSLVVDAIAVLDEMREGCQKSPELLESYWQLYHCLDYLKRFCDGKA